MSNGIGRVWAVNAEGGDEGRPNGVGPVYIENADQLGSKLPEPAAGDAGKVLGVLNSSGDIGWVEDQSGTLTQVQSDWTEDDSSQVSYIQNKPTLATVATSGSYNDLSNKPTIPTVDQVYDSTSANAQSGVAVAGAISGKQDTISDLSTIRSGAEAGATAVQPSQLATVATSGSYNDLSNKPTIPTVSDNVAKLQYGVATYAQVVAAFNAGKAIYLYDGDTDDGAVCSDITFGDDGGEIIFSRHNAYGSAGSRTEYKVTSSNVWSTTTKNVAVPTVDQSYSASSTNAQSGTAVASAISAVNQVPASTSADEDKVLTVNSSGTPVWAAAQGGGGSSYTFSAPLRESSGTVVLDVDTDELNIAPKTTALSAQRQISAAESGYAWYLFVTGDTSDTVYTFTFNNVPVSNNVAVAVNAQGKHIYPMLVGETYGGWGNQWIVPTALTFNSIDNTVSGSFNVCFKSGEQDYPTHLDSYGQLSWASVLVFAVASDVPSAQVSSSNIYGSTTSGSTVSYSTGGSMLMVKHPVPSVSSGDNGKVLTATYSNGVGTFGWDDAPTELPASLGTAGQVLTVNSGATGVEWSTVQSGSEYTAGDGIDISAQDAISVKAGNGITIGDYTYEHTGTLNLTATPVLNQGSYYATYIAQLTPELLAKMNSTGGLQVTLNGAYDGMGTDLVVGLATNATTYQTNLSNRVVFGDSLGTSIAAGTTVRFSFDDINSESTKSYADVAANVSSYYLVVFWIGYGLVGNAGQAAPSADPITTGTYTGTETVTVQNAVNLSTPIEVVASMPASPTSGVLYIVTGA